MYLSRLRIDGIKGFRGDRAVDLDLTRPDGSHAGWTVLAGRNGSGKTTLLQAIAIALSTPAQAYPLAPDLPSWRSAEPGRIELTVVEPAMPVAADGGTFGTRMVTEASCTWELSPSRPQGRAQVVWRRDTVVDMRPGWTSTTFSDVEWEDLLHGAVAGFGPYRRMSETGRGDGRAFAGLFDEDAALTEGIAWLIDAHHRSLEGRPGAAETVEAVIGLLDDQLLPAGLQIAGVSADGLAVRSEAEGEEFPLKEMSQGVRTAVALAVSLVWELTRDDPQAWFERLEGHMAVTRPGIVLIDEIDAHLHVTWQQRIGYWLKAHFPNIQFLVTTHSPYICQAADPGGLIRLGAPGDNTPPGVVDQDLYQRVVYGSGDDAILSELFGLESPFSPEADRIRRRAGDLEAAMMDGEATDAERAEYDELSARLTSSLSTRAAEVAALIGRHE